MAHKKIAVISALLVGLPGVTVATKTQAYYNQLKKKPHTPSEKGPFAAVTKKLQIEKSKKKTLEKREEHATAQQKMSTKKKSKNRK